jgi:predicted metal-dependent HD superfamily phosphohydrolase
MASVGSVIDTRSFVQAAVRLHADPDRAAALADELVSRWSAPGRHYHDVTHLAEMVALVHAWGLRVRAHTDLVVLAAWFHDAVYDPAASDNEQASADLAVEQLVAIGVGRLAALEVARLVLATAGHRYDPADVDAALIVDCDLAVLAADPVRYDEYRHGVRLEYSHVGDVAWAQGRAKVLEQLGSELDSVFHTAPGPDDARDQARVNLAHELAVLSSSA